MPPASSSPRRGLLALIVVVALLVGGATGYVTGVFGPLRGPATPATTSAEAGFARDMQVHHLQGAELALIAHEGTADPRILALSRDILLTQQQQSGQMFGWLRAWDLPQAASEPAMTWMGRPALSGTADGHDGMAMTPGADGVPATMPGLATPAQIDELEAASGTALDRTFLQLMIAHHRGAIEMADAVLARSRNTVVTTFAASLVTAQQAEISQMEALLTELPAG